MRKLIIGVMMIAFAFCGFVGWAHAQPVKKYALYLATSDTGVTTPKTVAITGVTSPLLIDDGMVYKRANSNTTLKGLELLPSGNAILYIDTVTASQAQQGAGGTYTGNTFFVVAKFGHSGSNFNLLEKIPLVLDMAMSGVTAYGIPFEIPPGTQWAQFFFGPSGVTNYGNFKASLLVGLSGTDWEHPKPIVIDEGTFTMPTSGSGVSQFTSTSIKAFPDGVKWVIIQGSASYYFSTNGTAPTSTNGFAVTSAPYVTYLTNAEARNLQMIAGAANSIIHYQMLSRKP